jgi:hypothetical protein
VRAICLVISGERVQLSRQVAVGLARKLEEFRITTTRIASTARSMARRPRIGPAHPHLLLPRLIVTLGGSIAAVYFRPPIAA